MNKPRRGGQRLCFAVGSRSFSQRPDPVCAGACVGGDAVCGKWVPVLTVHAEEKRGGRWCVHIRRPAVRITHGTTHGTTHIHCMAGLSAGTVSDDGTAPRPLPPCPLLGLYQSVFIQVLQPTAEETWLLNCATCCAACGGVGECPPPKCTPAVCYAVQARRGCAVEGANACADFTP